MNKRYAIIGPDNKAINFIAWDGNGDLDYGQAGGNYLVDLEGIHSYGFGWTWDGSSFVSPPEDAPSS